MRCHFEMEYAKHVNKKRKMSGEPSIIQNPESWVLGNVSPVMNSAIIAKEKKRNPVLFPDNKICTDIFPVTIDQMCWTLCIRINYERFRYLFVGGNQYSRRIVIISTTNMPVIYQSLHSGSKVSSIFMFIILSFIQLNF